MTYRELLEVLNNLSDDQLDSDISIYDKEADEFYSGSGVGYCIEGSPAEDILDPDHLYIIFPRVD